MAKSQRTPEKVFEHAECFYQAFTALPRINPDPRENLHATVTLAEPLIVLSAGRAPYRRLNPSGLAEGVIHCSRDRLAAPTSDPTRALYYRDPLISSNG
jgi:hypothetical protein